MEWSGVVMIMFSCVAANHLGLIAAVEEVINHKLPVVNCPKCFTWWALMTYGIVSGENVIVTVSASFLSAYAAIWLQLLFGIIDNQYNRIYGKVYPTADTADD